MLSPRAKLSRDDGDTWPRYRARFCGADDGIARHACHGGSLGATRRAPGGEARDRSAATPHPGRSSEVPGSGKGGRCEVGCPVRARRLAVQPKHLEERSVAGSSGLDLHVRLGRRDDEIPGPTASARRSRVIVRPWTCSGDRLGPSISPRVLMLLARLARSSGTPLATEPPMRWNWHRDSRRRSSRWLFVTS
jgi:hypothetical protein